MKTLTKTLVAGMILMAGAALAQAVATDPNVMMRQNLMKSQGAAAKVLGGMASGETPFDATSALMNRDLLAEMSATIPMMFTAQSTDPATKAKPEIWANWDDFVAKAQALTDAANAMDASSLEGVQAGMAAIGGACKACHTDYRM